MKNTRIVLLGLLLFLPACSHSGTSTTTRNGDRIKIGAFLSLTGATSDYGLSSLNGMKMAVDELNRSGGINGRHVELVVEDDHSNTQDVPAIVNKLITQDRVEALLAEPVSVRAMAAAPIAQQNQVVMISPASVKPELTMQGDYIFRACFISSTEGEAIAEFARNKLKAGTAAIILDDKNDYAVVLAGFFAEAFKKLGGQIVDQQTYEDSASELSKQMQAIKRAAPDVVFAPGFYTTAPLVAHEVKQARINAILIGSDGWDAPNLLEGGSDPFERVYFANHFFAGSQDPLVVKFVSDYRVRHGVEPDSAAATAYDAARLLFDAFKRAKSNDKAALRNALAETKDFAGVTGKITLDANRNALVPVYMLRIEQGKFTLQQ